MVNNYRARFSKADVCLLACIVLVGLFFRLKMIFFVPIGSDEISVIGRGMSEIILYDNPMDILFRIPVTYSNGITPLWWWIQLVPVSVFGPVNKIGLRLIPLLLGLSGIVLAYRAGQRLGGSTVAWFSGILYATGGIILYTNSKGDFVVSLIAPLILALLLDLLPRNDFRNLPLRVALWPALVLFTYFGHGLILWGAYIFYLTVLYIIISIRRDEEYAMLPFGRLVALVLLPLIPSLIWLLAAQLILFSNGSVHVTDIGPISSVWEHIRKLTWGYGTEVKSYMVGKWTDSLYVYTDFSIWPTTALIAIPGLSLIVHRARLLFGILFWGEPGTVRLHLLSVCMVMPTLGVLLTKGAIGGRFHLLYLPIVLPFIAVALTEWVDLLKRNKLATFVTIATIECLYVAWTRSWTIERYGVRLWGEFAFTLVIGIAVITLVIIVYQNSRLRSYAGSLAVFIVTVVLLVSSYLHGPLNWAQEYIWEPTPNQALPPLVEQLESPDMQLTTMFFEREFEREINAKGILPNDSIGIDNARMAALIKARRLLIEVLERPLIEAEKKYLRDQKK